VTYCVRCIILLSKFQCLLIIIITLKAKSKSCATAVFFTLYRILPYHVLHILRRFITSQRFGAHSQCRKHFIRSHSSSHCGVTDNRKLKSSSVGWPLVA
jgi:hypothetical protein